MKDFLLKIWKTPMFLIFVLIFVFLGLPALGKPAEIDRFAVVTALGIDIADEEGYEVSLLTFIPVAEQSFTQNYKVVSSSGKTLAQAIDYAGLNLGKKIGLSHLRTIVLGDELNSLDITNVLDFLTRDKEISSSTKLISTTENARDFLEALQQLDSQSSLIVSEIVGSNKDYVYSTDSSLETFFKGYFSPTKASLVPVFSLSEDGDGVAVSSQQTQGESQNANASDGRKKIVNSGQTHLFKSGKLVTTLSGSDMQKLNYFKNDSAVGTITLENFSDDEFENATLSFNVYDKKIRKRVVFENGIPIVCLDVRLEVMLGEVEQNDGMLDVDIDTHTLTKPISDAIEKKVRSEIADAINIMRQSKTDAVDFYALLHNSAKKNFQRFLNSLDDKDDYLSSVIFKTTVKVHSR
jgi:Ger(x)C family germination protein